MNRSNSLAQLLTLLCLLTMNAVSQVKPQVSPKLLWEHQTKSMPLAIVEDPDRAQFLYLALKDGGLLILETKQNSAKEVARIPKSSLLKLDCTNLAIKDNVLYLSLGNFFQRKAKAGLAAIDINNPRKPKLLSVTSQPSNDHGSHSIIIHKNYAYLCCMEYGIRIYNISNPSEIKFISSFIPDLKFPKKNYNPVSRPNARHAQLKGNILYVCYDAGGLRAIDISNPKAPKEIGRYINKAMKNKQQAYNEILIKGNIAYVSVDYAGLETLDISNPKAIKQLHWWNPWKAHTNKNNWFNSPGHGHQLSLTRKGKLLTMSAGDSELLVFSLRNPKQPQLLTSYGKPKNRNAAWSAKAGSNKIYIGYIKSLIPFRGTWSGIKAVSYPK